MRRLLAGSVVILVVLSGTAAAKEGKTKKELRKACHAMVAAQNDPDINGRTKKLEKALKILVKLGYGDRPGAIPLSEAGLGELCKSTYPKDRVIQHHDFTTQVPLTPNPDGSPPSCCTTTTSTSSRRG